MENWTEGQWMEWLDSRRDADCTPDDDALHDIHHWRGIERVVHEYIDWGSGPEFRSKVADIIRLPRSWQGGRFAGLKAANPWQWAVKHILTNMAKTA